MILFVLGNLKTHPKSHPLLTNCPTIAFAKCNFFHLSKSPFFFNTCLFKCLQPRKQCNVIHFSYIFGTLKFRPLQNGHFLQFLKSCYIFDIKFFYESHFAENNFNVVLDSYFSHIFCTLKFSLQIVQL